jgi:hypothetical protein
VAYDAETITTHLDVVFQHALTIRAEFLTKAEMAYDD